jgi:hypothetical protein
MPGIALHERLLMDWSKQGFLPCSLHHSLQPEGWVVICAHRDFLVSNENAGVA